MSDEMLNDLRNQAASARNEYEETCRQQQLALEQIHDQVASFEQVKARLEARIIELKDALKDAKCNDREEQIARLNEENASLRHTIENNLYNQANSEKPPAQRNQAVAPTARRGRQSCRHLIACSPIRQH